MHGTVPSGSLSLHGTVHPIYIVVTLIKQRISSLKETRCLGNLLIYYIVWLSLEAHPFSTHS